MGTSKLRTTLTSALLATAFLAAPYLHAGQPQDEKKQRNEKKYQENLMKEVRHQLVMLPYYSVFDNLAYQINGDNVTLVGQVVRPTLKSDAEAAVKSIEGVASVTNNIEVLPVSPNDDQIRRAVGCAFHSHHCEKWKRNLGRRGGFRSGQEHGQSKGQWCLWRFWCEEQLGRFQILI